MQVYNNSDDKKSPMSCQIIPQNLSWNYLGTKLTHASKIQESVTKTFQAEAV